MKFLDCTNLKASVLLCNDKLANETTTEIPTAINKLAKVGISVFKVITGDQGGNILPGRRGGLPEIMYVYNDLISICWLQTITLMLHVTIIKGVYIQDANVHYVSSIGCILITSERHQRAETLCKLQSEHQWTRATVLLHVLTQFFSSLHSSPNIAFLPKRFADFPTNLLLIY